MKIARSPLIAAAALALLAVPTDLVSCGPFLFVASFVDKTGFWNTNADYARKYIGIIGSDSYTQPLVMAYRYFSGLDLNQTELAVLYPGRKEAVIYNPLEPKQPLDEWLITRHQIPNAPPVDQINTYRSFSKPDEYIAFDNCLEDSFRNATATLKARIAQWGASSDEINDWLTGQDVVFTNCSGAAAQPAPVRPNASALLKADRAYQSAAATFYSGDYAEAHRRFLSLAKDTASPWHASAPYLAARCTLRDGTVNNRKDQLAAAARELAALKTHAANQLLQYTEIHLHPADRLAELSAQLSQPHLGEAPLQTMTDFRFCFLDPQTGRPRVTALHTPLTDWINVWRNPADAASTVAEWRQRQNLPWLVAALAVVRSDDAAVPELLAAARKVEATSPAFPSMCYYAARIAKNPLAWINRGLALKLKDSDHNQLLAQRFALARNFEEFLHDAPRRLSLVSELDGTATPLEDAPSDLARFRNTLAFDNDSVILWNRYVPLAQWIAAAKNPALAKNLRTDLARVGFVRAVLTDRQEEALAFLALWSELSPRDAKPALPYRETPDHFTAARILLRNPGLRPNIDSGFGRLTRNSSRDVFRDNWWCASPPLKLPPAIPAFLPRKPTPESVAMNRNASNFIPTAIIAYAEAHPEDPGVPQLLAKSLDVHHYSSCQSPDGTVATRKAFQLLKSRYADTKWARQTKYWY